MKNIKSIFLLAIMLAISCNGENSLLKEKNGSEHFTTHSELNNYLLSSPQGYIKFRYDLSKIFISFKKNTMLDAKVNLLQRLHKFKHYSSNDEISIFQGAIVYFEKEVTSKILEGLIATISKDPIVQYCSPYLLGGDSTNRTFTNKFYVKLKDKRQLNVLKKVLWSFNFITANQYKWDDLIFEISVNKLSQLNAFQISSQIERLNLFAFSQPDFIHQIKLASNDTYFNEQWALKNNGQSGGTIGADIDVVNAWNVTTGSSAIKVAILDCGVDAGNPDLSNSYYSGYDATGLGSGGLPNYSLLNNAHGTECAGIICAQANNNLGIAGIAPNCKFIAIRVATTTLLGKFSNSSSSIISDGINYAYKTAGADILSNSWGQDEYDNLIASAMINATKNGRNGKGALVFAASGNTSSTVSFPANISEVIAVGATDRNDRKTDFGNFGTNLDVSAPGVNITTTDVNGIAGDNPFGNYYSDFGGTSASCPMAAGVMALVLSVNPQLTYSQARSILETTCDKVGGYLYNTGINNQPNGTWSQQLGYGRINAYKAVLKAQPIQAQLPDLIVQNAQVNPSSVSPGLQVTVSCVNRNQGDTNASASITSLWLSSDQKYDGAPTDTYLGEVSVSSLAADLTSGLLSKTITLPTNLRTGTWYIMFGVDATGVVNELNEANNQFFVPITFNSNSAPPLASILTVTPECNGTSSQIALSWTASGNATAYDIYRNGSIYTSGISGTQFINTSVTSGQTYSYSVVAKNTVGSTSSNTLSATAPNCSLSLPGALILTTTPECKGTSSQVTLSWTTSVNATAYDIFRNGSLYASNISGTQYLNTSVISGQAYSYYVLAKNSAGSTSSNTLSATAPNCSLSLPGALILTTTPECNGTISRIRLNWTASSNATAYDIFRNGSLYAAGVSGTQYVNETVTVGASYSYYIKATNSAGSTVSNTASTIAQDCSGCVFSVAPTSLISSANNILPGTPITLTVSGGSLGTNASWYLCSGSCGGTPSGSGRSGTFSLAPTATTTYYIQAVGACNTTTCTQVTVTVVNSDPRITSFTPTTGITGTVVTITGANLQNTSSVSFGGTLASLYSIVSPTIVTATVGAGSSGSIILSAPVKTVSLPGFTYVFTLPASNFTLTANGAPCRGSSNGSINVVATKSENYIATVTRNGQSTQYPFTSSTTVNNFSAGSYSMCISIVGNSEYKQCFEVNITEPKDLSVYVAVDNFQKTATLKLAGGTLYQIELNGVRYATSKEEITLPIARGTNQLKVTADKLCQGVYQKTFNTQDGVLIYPNPFVRNLGISVGLDKSLTAGIEIRNISGRILYTKKAGVSEGIITLNDLPDLPVGVYILKLKLDTTEAEYKILRQ